MSRSLRQKVRELLAPVLGWEPAGEVALPRTGTDRSSMRQMLVLIVGTAAIMVVGLLVAFLEDDDEGGTGATPMVVTATADGE